MLTAITFVLVVSWAVIAQKYQYPIVTVFGFGNQVFPTLLGTGVILLATYLPGGEEAALRRGVLTAVACMLFASTASAVLYYIDWAVEQAIQFPAPIVELASVSSDTFICSVLASLFGGLVVSAIETVLTSFEFK